MTSLRSFLSSVPLVVWLGVGWLLGGVPLAAAVPVDPTPPRLGLTASAEVLEDPSGTLTLDEVRRAPWSDRFRPTDKTGEALELGFTHSAFWFRITLANPGAALDRYLVVANPRVSTVQAYLPAPTGYSATLTGCDVPTTRPYPDPNFVFPVALPEGAVSVLYVRTTSAVGLVVPLQLWAPEDYQMQAQRAQTEQAWYYGIVTAMVLFNLMLFVSLRERLYLVYVVFVGLTAFSLAVKNGLVPGSNAVYYSLVSLALAALMVFVRQMLQTRLHLARTDRWLKGLTVAYAASPVVFAWALPEVSQVAVIVNLATSVLVGLVAGMGALRGQRSAVFFLVAFGFLMAGGALTTLRALGVVPSTVLSVDGVQLGSALEMVLLAFALADRYNTLRREKDRVQDELLRSQSLLVQTLQTSERELEHRVAERTAELEAANARLAALSHTDGLTGLANRRHFDAEASNAWARGQRSAHPLGVAMVDVDWFKAYNDTYGHQAGDDCLRQVAQVLADGLGRSADLVARYGGEEFVVLAPGTDAEGMAVVGRALADGVAKLAIDHRASTWGKVTISVGTASVVPSPGQSLEDLVRGADGALYQAKAQGRNRVVAAGPRLPSRGLGWSGAGDPEPL